MTVYIVSFEKDCFVADKVFSTIEKAQKYMESKGYKLIDGEHYNYYCKMNDDGYTVGDIQEMDVI